MASGNSSNEHSEIEYDDYEEEEYLSDPSGIDYDPFSDENAEDESGGVEDIDEPEEEGEKSQRKSQVLEVSQPEGEDLFSFEGVFCERLFRNQLKPKESFVATVRGQSVKEIIDYVWQLSEGLIKRQIVFVDNTPP